MGWVIRSHRVSAGQPASGEIERHVARVVKEFVRDVDHKHLATLTLEFRPDQG